MEDDAYCWDLADTLIQQCLLNGAWTYIDYSRGL